MSKKISRLAVLAVLVGMISNCANAWVRSRMYDAVTPMGPQWPLLEKVDWSVDPRSRIEEYRTSELNGPTGDKRLTWRVIIPENTSTRGQVRVRISTSRGFDPSKDTSVLWSGCIVTPITNQTYSSRKTPTILIRLLTGNIKFAYNNDTTGKHVDGTSYTRGWYCAEGNVTSGGQLIYTSYDSSGIVTGTYYGMPVAHSVWHKIRITAYTNGTWKMWINDGDPSTHAPDMEGNLGPALGDDKFIEWAAPDSTNQAAEFYTEYFYWGQGAGEVDQIPEPIGGVSSSVSGDTATITWTTTKTTNINKVYYGKTFYNPDTPTWQAADAVNVGGVWTATLTDLDMSQTYTFYCESTDENGFEYDTGLYTFKTDLASTPPTQLLNPGFESGVDIYPWIDVYPPAAGADDTQHWGRVYKCIDYDTTGEMLPASGNAFSGFKTGGTLFRKNSTIRQKVTVEPGQWYRAAVKFCGWGNWPFGPDDMIGRIGLDPNGHDIPGLINGETFMSDYDVWWRQIGSGMPGLYKDAVIYAKALTNTISIFLQADYNASKTGIHMAFDDVSFGTSDITPPTTCAAVKASSVFGGPVDLKNVVVTAKRQTLDGTLVAYVEDADRTSGLRVKLSPAASVLWPYDIGIGSEVDLAGIIQLNADRELEVTPMAISPSSPSSGAVVYPIAMTNKSVGGSSLLNQVGVENGTGTNNIGLLAKVYGKVTAVGPPMNQYLDYSIFIDDGSGLTAGLDNTTATYPGIEIRVPGELYIDPSQFVPGQTYLAITGISSMKTWDPDGSSQTANSVQKPVILIRDSLDIQPMP